MAMATTWVVDPDGSGDAEDLTSGFALLGDGDTLEVHAGTYALAPPVEFTDNWTSARDIYVEGAGAAETIVDGSALPKTASFGLGFLAPGERIYGFTFRNFDTVGGALVSGDGPTEAELSVADCWFEDNSRAAGTYGGTLAITRSTFVRNDEAVALFNGWAELLTVENNVFVDNRLGVTPNWVDEYDEGGTEWLIANNTFVGGDWAFDFSSQDNSYPHTLDIIFADNLIAHTGVGWDIESLCLSCTFTGEFRNNLIGTDVFNTLRDDNGTTSFVESGTLHADPAFVSWSDDGDATNDDLHLAFGSPGIDKGVDGYTDADMDGRARPLDGDLDGTATTDIGAYEYAPDADGDGHDALDAGGDDCDDTDAAVHPGAPDLCDGIDGDCDGDDVPVGVACRSDCGCASAPPHPLALAALTVALLLRSRASVSLAPPRRTA